MSPGVFVSILAALASLIAGSGVGVLPSTVPADRVQLVLDLDLAQRTVDDPASLEGDLASAGQFEQLATAALAREPRHVQRTVLAGVAPEAAATMRANLAAAAALARLVTPRRSLPRWRILAPPAPDVLLSYFKAAQARFGVPWQYLAAVEFVETKFGRVNGLSSAGAEGPMQFMPSTWAHYGRGNVHDPRDAIFGAARFLVANGAPADMPGALFHYNPSGDYVAAITAYATRMRSDPRAYDGYYWWQVIFATRGGSVILPVGYPRARPVPLDLPRR